MPKVRETKERILIHVDDFWKRKNIAGWNLRWHDVGKKGRTMRMACQIPNKGWQTYAWSFFKSQVSKLDRTLICKDESAYNILSKMKEKGDLRGYKVIRK